MSSTKHHATWLSLLEISGPFLSVNTLNRVFPSGVDKAVTEVADVAELKAAYAEWQDERHDAAIHRAWIRYVLQTVLKWEESVLAEGQSIPETVQYTAIEHGNETVRPDYLLHERYKPNELRALVLVYPPEQSLEKPVPKKLWSSSPATRMLSLLHATGVRLGLVTNGEQWMLVNAPKEGLSGYISWYAELWGEDRETYRAFVSLLELARFFGVADEDTLPAMLDESANDAQEITDQLGIQVRTAVEILVRAFDRLDQDSAGGLLDGVSEKQLYQASLTVMMRLVFLLSAEERGLFLLGDPLYDQNYAISTLRAQLHEAADHSGEQVLERRSDAWSRLLATFRLVYYGSAHEDMQLPAYGGSLFDADRFPFLEGQSIGTPPAVNNRIVLHLLDALQILQLKGEARRLSFRALDIEQIGHVYEGLLDHEARRASEVMLGFAGKYEPEITLSELEAQNYPEKFLKEATGRGESAIKNDLRKVLDGDRLRRLAVVCGDEMLVRRVQPYLNLLRDDELGYPLVILEGSVFVTAGAERRATGTHYTPKSLTEPIVQHTLEPLVYSGMVDGLDREKWKLKSPTELLELKICDMAMGSGAFLVQTCRYLSARLVEAWEQIVGNAAMPSADKPIPRLTIFGSVPTNALGEILIPDDPQERLTLARRLIADRCLYGVDKNPLAVEMGKLSLWLTTLAKGRPFTFLDHALKCGDSLVGVSLEQLANWSLESNGKPKAVPLLASRIRSQIDEVAQLRRKLESFTVVTLEDQQEKGRLLFEAETRTHDLRNAGNFLLASYMNDYSKDEQSAMRQHLLEVVQKGTDVPEGYYPQVANVFNLPPFHWELEFPEVFLVRGGFDAFMGNPPFIGGQKITGLFGVPYRNYLIENLANGQKGSADICAYFFLRAFDNLRPQGAFGLIGTNTIAQGDTREVGLDQIHANGATFYRAVNNQPWEGAAAVVVNVLHTYIGDFLGKIFLDHKPVETISPLLDSTVSLGNPNQLIANSGRSFQGSITLGMGFVLTHEEAQELIDNNPHNKNVLFPYLNGEDLNSHPEQKPSRWVINFFDWSEEKAMQYGDCYSIVRDKVYPERIKQNDKGGQQFWWRYLRSRPELYATIAPLQRVLTVALTSKTVGFSFVSQDGVFANTLGIFAFDEYCYFALLQSNFHVEWAWKYSSSMKKDLRYTNSDIFETFPFPPDLGLESLEDIGENYHEVRRQIMKVRWEGLTATYNRFHNPAEKSEDIQELRHLHGHMDEAVAHAYGWDDLMLGHGFHETAQGIRYTINEAARREVLKRLLALNFERYEEEVKIGLHDKANGKGKKKKVTVSNADDDSKQLKLL